MGIHAPGEHSLSRLLVGGQRTKSQRHGWDVLTCVSVAGTTKAGAIGAGSTGAAAVGGGEGLSAWKSALVREREQKREDGSGHARKRSGVCRGCDG